MSLAFDLENLCFLRDTGRCGWEVGSPGGKRQELWPPVSVSAPTEGIGTQGPPC